MCVFLKGEVCVVFFLQKRCVCFLWEVCVFKRCLCVFKRRCVFFYGRCVFFMWCLCVFSFCFVFSVLIKFRLVVDNVTTVHGVHTYTDAFAPSVLIKCGICSCHQTRTPRMNGSRIRSTAYDTESYDLIIFHVFPVFHFFNRYSFSFQFFLSFFFCSFCFLSFSLFPFYFAVFQGF